MTWTTDSEILTLTQPGEPVKGSTTRKVHANIAAAFDGDSGAPPLNKVVTQDSLVTATYGERALPYMVTKTMSSGSAPYTLGDSISGTPFGLTGTYRVHGMVEVVPYEASPTVIAKWAVLLFRTA